MTDTGIYATAPRGSNERYRYAEACLKQGMSYQASAMAAGVNESDLRLAVPGFSRSYREPPPVLREPALARAAALLAEASIEEAGQIAALALATVHERCGLDAARIAVANIMAALPSLVPVRETPDRTRRIPAIEVAEYVAEKYGLTFAEMTSARKTNAIAHPRQLAMYLIRRLCPHMSYPAIGRLFGGRDHTTVIHGEQKALERIQTDPDVAAVVSRALHRFTSEAA